MARRKLFLLSFLSFLIVSACGKKGPIEPPLARVPQIIQGLSIAQKGTRLVLSWTNPTSSVDGRPLKDVAEVEIWMIEETAGAQGGAKKWTADEFEKKASLKDTLKKDRWAALRQDAAPDSPLEYIYPLNQGDTSGKILTFALRAKDEKMRPSKFCEPVSIEVRAMPRPPRNVSTAVFADRIDISWEPSAGPESGPVPSQPSVFYVYRSEGENPPTRLNSSPVKELLFQDKDFSFGKTYRYIVRAAADASSTIESDDSEVIRVEARDIFPPAPPAGLTAIAGAAFIALSWEASPEIDLAGYKVWRKETGQADFVLIKTLSAAESSWSDAAVEKSQRYDYAITALDNAGNESRRSEPVSAALRDKPR
jgi:predicted small lipoprotein YifL